MKEQDKRKLCRNSPSSDRNITLFICGDVMTGRGIDQILPYPCDPEIYESYMKSALGYVRLAEKVSGPIPRPADFSYIWGDALPELDRMTPDLTIINLETSVTRSEDFWRGKGINYRMSPEEFPLHFSSGNRLLLALKQSCPGLGIYGPGRYIGSLETSRYGFFRGRLQY